MYYRYSVLSKTGMEIEGIEKGSLQDIKERLLKKQYLILFFAPDYIVTLREFFERKRIKSQVLTVFFEDIANMLKTGLGINETLSALEETSGDKVLQKMLNQIKENVGRGFSLTEAFAKTDAFPILAISMIRVGEKAGGLEQVFSDLAQFYDRESKFKANLKNALIYPLVVFSLLIVVMFYISFNVIPKLSGLIMLNGKIHPATKVVLALSAFLQNFWWVVLFLPVGLFVAYGWMRRNRVDKIAAVYYKLPVIGGIFKDIALSAMFLNLSILQKNGIGIIDSMDLLAESTPYKFLSRKFLIFKDWVLSGLCLWQAFEKEKFFPPFVYHTVRKGEEMGRLGEYLASLSRYYSLKVTRQVDLLLTFVQPALLGVCAGFLLLVVMSFIAPIYANLSDIAGGAGNF